MKFLRHLLMLAYMLGLTHEFIPHEHHGEARGQAILISEDSALESGSLWRHLLEALGALEHPSTGAEFHFYAPDEAAASMTAEVVMSLAVLPRETQIPVVPRSALLDGGVPVHPPPDGTYKACPPPGRGSPLA